MTNNHEWLMHFVNTPLVAALVSTPWWLPKVTLAIESFHWFSGMFVLPALGIVLAVLQIAYMIRKHKQL